MVEFALVLPLVLLLLLGCVQVGLYGITRGTAITAAERATRVAAGASGSQGGSPATAAVYAAVRDQLGGGLVGARTEAMDPVGGACPSLDASWPRGVVYVCMAANRAQGTVEVAVRGWVDALVPPGFGLGSWRPGSLPIDVDDVVHTSVFAA